MKNSPLLNIIKREFDRISKRKTLYVLSIFLPLILVASLALIYKNKVVTDLPVAVIDNDNSEISRMMIRAIDASSSMNVTQRFSNLEKAKEEFRKGNIEAVFVFPNGFSQKIKSGNFSNVSIYKNSSSAIIGTLIYRDSYSIIKTFSGGIQLKKLLGKNLNQHAAMNLINPVRIEANSLYNPNYNYLSYLIPGLATSMLQMIIM